MKKTRKKKPSSFASFQLESLPTISADLRYHAYRGHFAEQERLGNSLGATDWGWERTDDMLIPIYTDRPVASDFVLRMVSCRLNPVVGNVAHAAKLV